MFHNSSMSRLAHPTPATRRLGSFTLDKEYSRSEKDKLNINIDSPNDHDTALMGSVHHLRTTTHLARLGFVEVLDTVKPRLV